MAVQVITDSTSDIPQQVADELGIFVVPIYVSFGNKSYRDGVDLRSDTFYKMLATSPVHPTTSQPNPENFTTAYERYCDKVDGIVSIHISSKISGTYNSANIARKTLESRCPIEVIDSKFNSAGLGLIVLAAARLARSGAGLSEVVHEAYNAISQVRMYGMFETMKYLARSGRISKTIATASRILNVMPLLTFHDGDIVRAGFVRTINKGMEHIHHFVRSNIPVSELTIVHSAVEEQAERL
jgi:DegV family protein with EDD domain